MKTLITRAKKINKEIEKLKKLYGQLDEITEKLVKQKFKSSDGVELVDNFKTKNVAFRTTSVKRYELRFEE